MVIPVSFSSRRRNTILEETFLSSISCEDAKVEDKYTQNVK